MKMRREERGGEKRQEPGGWVATRLRTRTRRVPYLVVGATRDPRLWGEIHNTTSCVVPSYSIVLLGISRFLSWFPVLSCVSVSIFRLHFPSPLTGSGHGGIPIWSMLIHKWKSLISPTVPISFRIRVWPRANSLSSALSSRCFPPRSRTRDVCRKCVPNHSQHLAQTFHFTRNK